MWIFLLRDGSIHRKRKYCSVNKKFAIRDMPRNYNSGDIMVTPKCESLKTTIAYYEQHGKTVEAGAVRKMLDECEEENETVSSLPPIWIRGMNFASAMASHAVDGFRRCEQAEIDSRLAICQQCPQLVNNHCNLCGCACVEENKLTNKLALKSSACPQGKW